MVPYLRFLSVQCWASAYSRAFLSQILYRDINGASACGCHRDWREEIEELLKQVLLRRRQLRWIRAGILEEVDHLCGWKACGVISRGA